LFPGLGIQPPAFAMVGMAAVLAGAVHAPLTAVILLFEMTRDYRIILPLLFAVAVSLTISRRVSPDSVYMLGLARHGIRLQRGRDVDVLDSLTVGEIMSPVAHTLAETATLGEADHAFALTHHHGMPVLDGNGSLVGVVTLGDLQRAHEKGVALETKVEAICTREMLTAFPDESIGAALRRMSVRDVGRLPVVSRGNPHQLLGILTRADVIRAYDLAATRRAVARHAQEQVRLGVYAGLHTVSVTVRSGAAVADHAVRDVAWPPNCVIASIRRRGEIFVPRGETIIRPGDVLVAVLGDGAENALRALADVA
jgi:CIC family chloride channel protein